MKIIRMISAAWLVLAAGHARSETLVTASENSVIVAREPDGIWQYGATYNALPAGIAAGPSWKSLDAGRSHGLVLDGNGALFAWGDNGAGQLGTGNFQSADAFPLPVAAGSAWKSVSAGGNLSAGIKVDGSLWTWGAGISGESGTASTIPIAVGTGMDWKSVATGSNHRLAIHNDGSLWAWGYNSHGTLGDGSSINRSVPVRIGIENDWASAACGLYTSFAVKTDGSLWVWGNVFGDGNGNTSSQVPIRLGSDSDWRTIYACPYVNYTFAIKQDGSLWSWGYNSNGVLGHGDTDTRLVPTRVGSEVDWEEVAPAENHVIAIKNDGSIWQWGYSPNGQIPASSIPVDRSSFYISSPQMRVHTEQVGASTSGDSWQLRTTILNEPVSNFLRIQNDGMAPLSISAINLPPGFTLDSAPSEIPPLDFRTVQVRLAAVTKGQFSGAAHILSDQASLPDFIVNLNGTVVSALDDSDSDGLNDAAEVSMEALGFRWNSQQLALVDTLIANSKFAGLLPSEDVFEVELKSHPLVVTPATQSARIGFDFLDAVSGAPIPFSMRSPSESPESGIQIDFPLPNNREYLRIRER